MNDFQRKIQLFSDDTALCAHLEKTLSANGYVLSWAPTWAAAQRHFMPPPLIALVDFRLKNGIELIQKIKTASPTTECTILSPDPHCADLVEAINIGASNYLIFPIDLNQLLAILRRTLEHFQIRRLYQESEARFRSIVETIDDAIVLLNSDGRIYYLNDAAALVFGYLKGELINASIRRILVEDQVESFFQNFQDFVQRASFQSENTQFKAFGLRKDRSVLPLELKILFFEADGRKFYTLTLYDLTEQVELEAQTETVLRRSEERYRNLFESVPVGLYRTTLGGRFVDANQTLVDILGFPSREALQKVNVSSLYAVPNDREKLKEDLIAQGIVHAYPMQLRRYDGRPIWVEGYTRAVQDQHEGTILEGALMDVTERIHTEMALKDSQERLRTLSSATFEGIVLTDNEKIIDANEQFANILGYQLDEILGTQVASYVHPDDLILVNSNFEASIENAYQHRAIHKDGTIIFVEVRPQTVEIGGKLLRITAVRDVTERKQTEEQLRLQAAALDAAANGVMITDLHGEILWANPALEDLTGYTLDELIGQTSALFRSQYHDQEFYADMEKVLRQKQIWQGEIINRRKNGEVYPEHQTIAPVLNASGQISHYVAIKQDISERKKAEEAIRASEEKFATIFRSSPSPVSITTFPAGVFVDVNESFLEISGYARKELIGNSIDEIGLWTDLDDQKYLVNTLRTDRKITNFETDYHRKNGEISTALLSSEFITLDGETFLLTSYHDIFDRKQAEAEIRRRIRQLGAINEMGQLVASSLELSAVFDQVVRAIPSLVDAEWVTVQLLEYQGELVIKAVGGEGSERLLNKRIPSTRGWAETVIQSEQPVLAVGDSLNTEQEHYIQAEFGIQIHSLLMVPLILGGNLIGVMEAIHSKVDMFDMGDLDVMGTAGTWVAIAIANARQHEALQRRLHESQALASISQALNETLNLDRVLELIVDSARRIIPQAERAVIHLFNPTRKILEPIAVSSTFNMGEPYLVMKPGEGIAGQVMESGMTINIRDTRVDPRFIPVTGQSAAYMRSLLTTAVQSGERRLGTISISSAAPDAFSPDDSHILSILGVQAALAIESARLFEETQQRAHYLQMLNDMTSTALQIPDLPTMLQAIAGQLVVLFEADGVYITHWNEETRTTELVAFHGDSISLPENPESLHTELSITESVLQVGKVLALDDVFDSPFLSSKIAALFPAKSLLALPLIADDQKLGAALVGFNHDHYFSQDEIDRGELFSQQVTLALAKAQILEAERKRRQEAETLSEVAAAISSTLELDILLEQILINLETVVPYDSAGVILIEGDQLWIEAGRGFPDGNQIIGKEMPVISPFLMELKDKKVPIISDDVQLDDRWVLAEPFRYIHSWIGTVLMVQNEVIGFLTIDNHKVGIYSASDAILAQAFASQVATAIQNARLYDATLRRLNEVNTLYYINNQMLSSVDIEVDSILRDVVNMLKNNFDYYHVHVYMLDQEKRVLTVQQGSGPIGEQLARNAHHLSVEEGVVGYVASVGDTFMSNNVASVHFYKPNDLLPHTHAEMATPLRARGELFGVLDIQHSAPNIFTADDIRLVKMVADQLSIVLDKAMLYSELELALDKEQSIRSQLVQSEKLAAMGRLIASVAHELNNPLQAIQNALYLVKMEEQLSDQAVEDLQVALDETNRMGNLISRLRDTYRPSGPDEFKVENLNTIVRDVHRLIGTHLRHSNVTFEFIADPSLPAVLMNSDHIKQVVLNLCMNGIESMLDGGRLTVQTLTVPAKNEVMCRVSDTGAGIAPDVISRIFEPFYTTKEKGTGLGLYISYEIIENHAGTLEVVNHDAHGTTFQFSLPAEMGIDMTKIRNVE